MIMMCRKKNPTERLLCIVLSNETAEVKRKKTHAAQVKSSRIRKSAGRKKEIGL